MKTHAILFTSFSVLLVSCQSFQENRLKFEQDTKDFAFKKHIETEKYIDNQKNYTQKHVTHVNILQHDLWNFITEELKMYIPDNARIKEQEQYFLKQKNYLQILTSQAEPYIYWIVEQIKQRKMPMELVLLPILESSFNPKATSESDAAGIWQIIPQTGKYYGLKQNKWYDGRRDIVASTSVALDIMQRLNDVFNGDWLLTIAAYNGGEGCIMRAIKRNKEKGIATDFWSLTLPHETTIYIPKMLALSKLIKNRTQFGIVLPKSNKKRALSRVEVGKQITLIKAAKMSGLSLMQLKSFNTGYKRNITAPNGPHYILLPKEHAYRLCMSLSLGKIKGNAMYPVCQ